jgi:hypothetical protein
MLRAIAFGLVGYLIGAVIIRVAKGLTALASDDIRYSIALWIVRTLSCNERYIINSVS